MNETPTLIIPTDALMSSHGEVYQTCSVCGCPLAPYEVFAQRIRGIKKPACIGCLADAIRDIKLILLPALNNHIEQVFGVKESGLHRALKQLGADIEQQDTHLKKD